MPVVLAAQARVIKVVSSDGQPIAYANVIVEGGTTQVTDDKGEVSLGAGKSQTLTLNVRRIGFTPWFGKMDLPDTAAVLVVTLPQLAQSLSAVTVTGAKDVRSPLVLSGFYDRWIMRQKGLLSAVFISPEELEFRHPDKITGMLNGLNGVQLARACVVVTAPHRPCETASVAFSAARSDCPMAIVVDGLQQFPDDQHPHIDINMLLNASDVSAIEVYARGGNMPIGFQFQDTGCGVLAFWTGSRKP
ncbi:MAG: hypothetical protein ACREN6_14960 [Gemmatimonadaceae bacterium]